MGGELNSLKWGSVTWRGSAARAATLGGLGGLRGLGGLGGLGGREPPPLYSNQLLARFLALGFLPSRWLVVFFLWSHPV